MTRPHRLLDETGRAVLKAVALLSAAAFAAGLRLAPQGAWGSLLLADVFLLSLALAGAVFVALNYLSSSGWATLFRRVPEAMTGALLAGAALTAVLLLGTRTLYPWAGPEAAADPVLAGKAAWLNRPFFSLRAAAYLALWIALARTLVRRSRLQDASKDPALTARNVGQSALFLVVFAATFTLATIDWLMSLEPRWFSTIYPWYVFSGLFVSGIAGLTALLIALRRRGAYPELNRHHLHDLGKYLFAFSVFWAYLWFSQFLLIWYSNIPEETVHYVLRLSPGWRVLFWLNPLANFAVPFFVLLTVKRKSSERILLAACAVILAGHVLDLHMLIMPSIPGPRPLWLEADVLAGAAALFLLSFDADFARAGAVPSADPYLSESLHHHV